MLQRGVGPGGAAGEPVPLAPGPGAHPDGVPGAGDVEDRLGDAVGDPSPDQPQRRRRGSRRGRGAARPRRPAPASASRSGRAGGRGRPGRRGGSRPPSTRRRRRGGRSRGPRAARARLAANRSPPMCETSQVSSGCARGQGGGDRAAALGAAGVVPAVGAHAEQPARSVAGCQPGAGAGAQPLEVEVEDARRGRARGRSRARAGRGGRTPRRPGRAVAARAGPGAPDQQDADPGGGGAGPQAGAETVRQPGVAQRVDAPRARVLDAAGTRARSRPCR